MSTARKIPPDVGGCCGNFRDAVMGAFSRWRQLTLQIAER